MRKFILVEQPKVKSGVDARIAVFYQSDGLEDLQHEFVDCGKKSLMVRRSDVSVLLNQKLLDKRNISPLALQRFADSLRSASSSELLKGQSDEVLSSVIKSRYVQSPADVYRYNCTIERDLLNLEEDVQHYVEENKQSVEPSTESLKTE